METIFKIYFNYYGIRLDDEGLIENANNCVYIAEYEWNEDTEEIGKFIRRIDYYYDREAQMDITVAKMEDMESLNENFESAEEASDTLDKYLDEYKIWRTIYGGYYDPDEYVCEGLEDRSEVEYRQSKWCK